MKFVQMKNLKTRFDFLANLLCRIIFPLVKLKITDSQYVCKLRMLFDKDKLAYLSWLERRRKLLL